MHMNVIWLVVFAFTHIIVHWGTLTNCDSAVMEGVKANCIRWSTL